MKGALGSDPTNTPWGMVCDAVYEGKHMRRLLIWPLMLAAAVLALAGCSSPEPVQVGDSTVIIDVRTPEEFASGHLDGAVLMDLNGGQFAAELPDLDPDAEYLVYCRSGNRAAKAVEAMKQAGIANATNLGSLEDAAKATGGAVVS